MQIFQNVVSGPSSMTLQLHCMISPCSQCDDLRLHLPFLERSNTLISVARKYGSIWALMTLMRMRKSKVNPLLEFHMSKGTNMTHAACWMAFERTCFFLCASNNQPDVNRILSVLWTQYPLSIEPGQLKSTTDDFLIKTPIDRGIPWISHCDVNNYWMVVLFAAEAHFEELMKILDPRLRLSHPSTIGRRGLSSRSSEIKHISNTSCKGDILNYFCRYPRYSNRYTYNDDTSNNAN